MDEKNVIPEKDTGSGSSSGDRSGGVNFSGEVTVHGDVIAQDQNVYGDRVKGDKIDAQIGDVGARAQVGIGKDIKQTITPASTALTAAELAELHLLLAGLKNQLARLEIPENKKLIGQEFVTQLEQELTKTEQPADASIIKVAGNWLMDNIPALTGTITGVFVSPIVGKVVEAAGDLAVKWVKERFGSNT